MIRARVLCLLALAGCLIFRRPVVLPEGDEPAVLLLSGPLGAPMDKIARHAWFAVRAAGQQKWYRWEVWGGGSSVHQWGDVVERDAPPLSWEPGGRVAMHGVLRGDDASDFIRCLERESPRYEYRSHYVFWPGPNSNTYVEHMLRRCGMFAALPATCVGKDYRGVLGISMASGGTGFQVDSPLIGFKIGLTEGIELHLFTLSIGIDLWPPAIILPYGEGRIGFDDR